jgi:hypothetical protein
MASLLSVLIVKGFLIGEAGGTFDRVRLGGGAILIGDLGIADLAAAFDKVELAFLLDAAVLFVSVEVVPLAEDRVVLAEDTVLARGVSMTFLGVSEEDLKSAVRLEKDIVMAESPR